MDGDLAMGRSFEHSIQHGRALRARDLNAELAAVWKSLRRIGKRMKVVRWQVERGESLRASAHAASILMPALRSMS